MTIRTTTRIASFSRPFMLGAFSEQFPAGRYSIETEEELLDGMYFPAYMRPTTVMHLIPDPRRPGITEHAEIDPFQLEAALALDAVLASISSPGTGYPLTAPGTEQGAASRTAQPAETSSTLDLTEVKS
jgi:hypothetical protein